MILTKSRHKPAKETWFQSSCSVTLEWPRKKREMKKDPDENRKMEAMHPETWEDGWEGRGGGEPAAS